MLAGLVGAVIGATASVIAQVVNQRQIRRREDRDKLRDACAKYAECAYLFVQAAEVAAMASAEAGELGTDSPLSPGTPEMRFKFVMDAAAAQASYSAAFCRLVMLRHGRADVDDGEQLYRRLMTLPKRVSRQPGESCDELSKRCSASRQDVMEWLKAQSGKVA